MIQDLATRGTSVLGFCVLVVAIAISLVFAGRVAIAFLTTIILILELIIVLAFRFLRRLFRTLTRENSSDRTDQP